MSKTLFASAALSLQVLPALLALSLAPAHAALNVTSAAFSYSQSFDSLAAAGAVNA